ncbi:hypothetical protein H9P43_002927 [Blastocladiella emersonii ATCC 22665]|nr:hypothetical protein H9P43_002927 [Blastocladiella emersonii ATCC 22665]
MLPRSLRASSTTGIPLLPLSSASPSSPRPPDAVARPSHAPPTTYAPTTAVSRASAPTGVDPIRSRHSARHPAAAAAARGPRSPSATSLGTISSARAASPAATSASVASRASRTSRASRSDLASHSPLLGPDRSPPSPHPPPPPPRLPAAARDTAPSPLQRRAWFMPHGTSGRAAGIPIRTLSHDTATAGRDRERVPLFTHLNLAYPAGAGGDDRGGGHGRGGDGAPESHARSRTDSASWTGPAGAGGGGPGGRDRDRFDLKSFAESRLYRVWRHRRGIVSFFVALLLLAVGVAIGIVLFYWFRGVERSYARSEVRRRCGSLADSLKLEFNTNLNTFIVDYAGFMGTSGSINNRTLISFAENAANQSDRLFGVMLAPLLSGTKFDLYSTRYNFTIVRPVQSQFLLISFPITLRFAMVPMSRTPFIYPIGYDLQVPIEFSAAIRTAFATGRPALALGASNVSYVPPPRERIYVFARIEDAPDPQFSSWIMTAIVDSAAILAANFDPGAVNGLAIELVDQSSDAVIHAVPSDEAIASDMVHVSVDIVDRVWLLSCTSTQSLRRSFATPWPFVLLFIVIALFLILAEILRRGLLRFLAARAVAHRVEQQAELVTAIRTYSTGILRAVRDPLLVLDGLGYIIGLNQDAIEKLGLTGDFAQAHVSDLIPSSNALTTLAPGTYEVGQLGAGSGRAFFAEATVSEVASHKRGELAQVLLLHDVTDRIHMLQSIQVAEQAANRASASKTQLLYFVCHEMRNPMYVIETLVESVQALLPVRETRGLARVQRAVHYVSDLLGNLVDLMADDPLACTDRRCGLAVPIRAILDDAVRPCRDRLAARAIAVQLWVVPDSQGALVDFDHCICLLRRVVAKATFIAIHSSCAHATVDLELAYSPATRAVWFHSRGPVCTPYTRLELFGQGPQEVPEPSHPEGSPCPSSSPAVSDHGGGGGPAPRDPQRSLDKLHGSVLSLGLTVVDALLRPIGGTVAQFQHPKRGGLDISLQLPYLPPRSDAPPVTEPPDGRPTIDPTNAADRARAGDLVSPAPGETADGAVAAAAEGDAFDEEISLPPLSRGTSAYPEYAGASRNATHDLTHAIVEIYDHGVECPLQTAVPVPLAGLVPRPSGSVAAESTARRATPAPPEPVVHPPEPPRTPPHHGLPNGVAVAVAVEDDEDDVRLLSAPPSPARSVPIVDDVLERALRTALPPSIASSSSRAASFASAVTSQVPLAASVPLPPSPLARRATASPAAVARPPSVQLGPATPGRSPLGGGEPVVPEPAVVAAKPEPAGSPPSAAVPRPPSLPTTPSRPAGPAGPALGTPGRRPPPAPADPAAPIPGTPPAPGSNATTPSGIDSAVAASSAAASAATTPARPSVPASQSVSTTASVTTTPARPSATSSVTASATASASTTPVRLPVPVAATAPAPASAATASATTPLGITPSRTYTTAEPAAPAPPPPLPEEPAAPKKRVLVVEDNALVQRVTRKLVEGLGFEAESAMDGVQGVAKVAGPGAAAAAGFDLVLMDLVMPNMGGHEAMAAIRAAGFGQDSLPIVAVTANALPEERERCLEAGFNVFLTKPLKKEVLREVCVSLGLL